MWSEIKRVTAKSHDLEAGFKTKIAPHEVQFSMTTRDLNNWVIQELLLADLQKHT